MAAKGAVTAWRRTLPTEKRFRRRHGLEAYLAH
jgi:hypothetical protein